MIAVICLCQHYLVVTGRFIYLSELAKGSVFGRFEICLFPMLSGGSNSDTNNFKFTYILKLIQIE